MENLENIIHDIKKKNWKFSILFSILSSIVIISIYFRKPENSNFAGSILEHNLLFSIPMFLLSFALGIIGLSFYIPSVRKVKFNTRNEKFKRIYLPIILLAPFLIHLLTILIFIIKTAFINEI